MNKTIHIHEDNVLEQETRNYFPLSDDGEEGLKTELHLYVKRTLELEQADENDILIYIGKQYRVRWKNIDEAADGPIELGLLC